MLRQRRALEDEKFGFTDFGAPPLAKLPAARPETPEAEDTDEWHRRPKRLDKPVMMRVLQALEERLRREETAREKAEARLARHDTLRQSGSLSFSTLPYHEKCKAMAA